MNYAFSKYAFDDVEGLHQLQLYLVVVYDGDASSFKNYSASRCQDLQCSLLVCPGEHEVSCSYGRSRRALFDQVYECMVRGIAVMRRRADSFVNATQILKVAGVDKGRRTKILEKEILPGKHEIVQGGYGKYQGTWSVNCS